MSIVALIPCYNEIKHIAGVVQRTRPHLPVVVIDDGSTDGSGAAAAAAGATVLTHTSNRGKGAALATGISWALEQGCEAVVTLDADAQHDPDEIPTFLDAYRRDLADMIIGLRDFSQMPSRNSFGNRLGNRILGRALRRPIPDNQCGYRLLNRRAMETLDFNTTGFEFEVEMIVQSVSTGLRMAWVPIRTIYAGESSHFRPFGDSVEFVKTAWRARQRVRRERGRG
ncbi:MAG: glycosyltransferase family 2 protein [Chloroflexi bacterium]|nr:glycosyltransferase family 2 protein [Chloroflexota bacterium]